MDRPRILVVDDEPAARRLLARILEKKGYEARTVGDVSGAIDLLEEEHFDLVMTDLDMPGASGFDLIQALAPRSPEVATILVTGRGSTEVASTALMSGAYAYLTKPFMSDEVEISVINALRRRELELESRDQKKRLEEMVRERTSDLVDSLAQLQEAQEELKRKAEELQELDRMKAQFIQVVSHELRTPLTVIKGGVQTVMRGGDTIDPKLRGDLLNSVETNATALGSMINKILMAASLGRRDPQFGYETFDLAEVAREALPAKDADGYPRLVVRTLEATAYGHRELVQEAARDLIENGLIHTDGKVTVSTWQAGDEAVLSVADEGKGIPEDLLKRLLEQPFVQADASTTRSIGGLGLSLYLAKQIAEVSGGRLEAECPPSGSTFTIFLPTAPPA